MAVSGQQAPACSRRLPGVPRGRVGQKQGAAGPRERHGRQSGVNVPSFWEGRCYLLLLSLPGGLLFFLLFSSSTCGTADPRDLSCPGPARGGQRDKPPAAPCPPHGYPLPSPAQGGGSGRDKPPAAPPLPTSCPLPRPCSRGGDKDKPPAAPATPHKLPPAQPHSRGDQRDKPPAAPCHSPQAAPCPALLKEESNGTSPLLPPARPRSGHRAGSGITSHPQHGHHEGGSRSPTRPCGGTRDGMVSPSRQRHPGRQGGPGAGLRAREERPGAHRGSAGVPRRVHPSWRPQAAPRAREQPRHLTTPLPGHLRRPLPAPKRSSTAASSYSLVGPAHELCPSAAEGNCCPVSLQATSPGRGLWSWSWVILLPAL